ncbi:hypothetical protein G7046_g8834 [Stylonectria norvegica]|nr:hypothetical protein G7046_g8834 [Stylonectria norvegica]
MDELKQRFKQGVEYDTMHKTLRLLATGSDDVPSKATSVLFQVLGQHEWQFRVKRVQELLAELDKGGPDLAAAWTVEGNKQTEAVKSWANGVPPTKLNLAGKHV